MGVPAKRNRAASHPFGCDSKVKGHGYAGFSSWFHLPRCHFGLCYIESQPFVRVGVPSTSSASIGSASFQLPATAIEPQPFVGSGWSGRRNISGLYTAEDLSLGMQAFRRAAHGHDAHLASVGAPIGLLRLLVWGCHKGWLKSWFGVGVKVGFRVG